MDLEAIHEVADNRQVQVDELFEARGKQPFNKAEMVSEVGSIPIGALEAFQVLTRPAPLVADSHLVDVLFSQTLLPNWNGHPQGALIVLKAVSADPRRTMGQLNFVQDDQDVGEEGFVEKTREGAKIRLISRDNHVVPLKPSQDLRPMVRFGQVADTARGYYLENNRREGKVNEHGGKNLFYQRIGDRRSSR